MKIKSRKEREKEYSIKYGNISDDAYTRLKDKLGEDFNEDLLQSALNRIKETKKKLKYSSIKITFYEEPIQSHRPRVNYYTRNMHVPNAKENSKALEKFISKLKKDISIVTTPMKISIDAYYPMPTTANPIEMVIYETKHDYGIGKPDFDNVLKAYTDMLLNNIILDDDLVASSSFNKYYSLKPRVELIITYLDDFTSEYVYKTIKNRKGFKTLSNLIDAELLVTPYKKSKKKKKGK